MSDKNLTKKFNNLITIKTEDGKIHQLWGLILATRDKRQQWQMDQDYIPKLLKQFEGNDPIKSKEARDGLLFLNAFILAELDGNFKYLEELGYEPSDKFKKGVYNSRNSAQRDFIGNNQGAQEELTNLINPRTCLSIGEIVDNMRETKKLLRKSGRSVSELYKKVEKKKPTKNMLPVKVFNKEELENFNKEYFMKKR